MPRKPVAEEPKRGVPAYMVSFGDMMTLILTFFILLVSMAQEQNLGLVAKGLGSFVVALESHGMRGIMSEQEKVEVFQHYRRRFNLPPEPDADRRPSDPDQASQHELIPAELIEALEPHDELAQPMVASFEPGSAELGPSSRRYLDRLADSLRPAQGMTLLLEGHAGGEPLPDGDLRLAFTRAQAVRRHLIEAHRFPPGRVEARAWLEEIQGSGEGLRSVDARLIAPDRPDRW